jgi:putative transposase
MYRYPWLEDPPSQALQQVARDLAKALKNAFNPKMPQAFPVFKRKADQSDSFRIPQGFTWDKEHGIIEIPKLGRLKYFSSSKTEKIVGEPTQVTISREGKHWFVSIGVEFEIDPEPVHPKNTAVGIDMGVVNFASFSDGEVLAPLNSFKRIEEKLAAAQQTLSHKVKFSSNWRKQVAVVNGIHRTIANCRKDYINKASTTVSNNHAFPVMEDLHVANMTASAAGTFEEPGKNVAAKSGLNKSILDQGWGDFRRKLTYKEQWRGGKVILVPSQGTSQECPLCGHKHAENRRTRDTFSCLCCGFTGDADLVAATNILRRGTPYLPAGIVALGLQEPIRHEEPAMELLGAGISRL